MTEKPNPADQPPKAETSASPVAPPSPSAPRPTSPPVAPTPSATPIGTSFQRRRAPTFFQTQRGNRLVRDVALIVGIFIAGYLLAFIWLSPGPLISSDHAVPRVLEMSATEAERELNKAGFRPRRGETHAHPVRDAGTVIWQDPPAGTVLPEGTPITLTISDGKQQTPVPDLDGLEPKDAEALLRAGGLRIERTERVPDDGTPGIVIGTRPAAGPPRPVGSAVTLLVSQPRIQ